MKKIVIVSFVGLFALVVWACKVRVDENSSLASDDETIKLVDMKVCLGNGIRDNLDRAIRTVKYNRKNGWLEIDSVETETSSKGGNEFGGVLFQEQHLRGYAAFSVGDKQMIDEKLDSYYTYYINYGNVKIRFTEPSGILLIEEDGKVFDYQKRNCKT